MGGSHTWPCGIVPVRGRNPPSSSRYTLMEENIATYGLARFDPYFSASCTLSGRVVPSRLSSKLNFAIDKTMVGRVLLSTEIFT